MSKIVPFPRRPTVVAQTDIEAAVSAAADRYFAGCRQRIPGLIDRHFRYPGAIRTNRVALGWDLLRAPLNLFWAPVYALLCLLRFSLRKLGYFPRIQDLLQRTPAGFTTRVQTHISDLILAELLNTPDAPNLLEDTIIAELQSLAAKHQLPAQSDQQFHQLLEPIVEAALIQYQVTRTASADITNSLTCTLLGAFAFQKFTPGGIGIAFILASLLSQFTASRNFWLGDQLGSLYYQLFPPTPSLTMTIGMLALVMTLLAILAALSGMLIDPIQAASGLHQRRLHKLIDHLEKDFQQKTQGSFRPRDQFVARIMDAFDLLRAGF